MKSNASVWADRHIGHEGPTTVSRKLSG